MNDTPRTQSLNKPTDECREAFAAWNNLPESEKHLNHNRWIAWQAAWSRKPSGDSHQADGADSRIWTIRRMTKAEYNAATAAIAALSNPTATIALVSADDCGYCQNTRNIQVDEDSVEPCPKCRASAASPKTSPAIEELVAELEVAANTPCFGCSVAFHKAIALVRKFGGKL